MCWVYICYNEYIKYFCDCLVIKTLHFEYISNKMNEINIFKSSCHCHFKVILFKTGKQHLLIPFSLIFSLLVFTSANILPAFCYLLAIYSFKAHCMCFYFCNVDMLFLYRLSFQFIPSQWYTHSSVSQQLMKLYKHHHARKERKKRNSYLHRSKENTKQLPNNIRNKKLAG